MFLFIKKKLYSITFRNILIIFSVGLASRILVNHLLEINVFKEYTSYISLTYYFAMASFITLINYLPPLNWEMLNVNVISEAISIMLFGRGDNMIIGGYFCDNSHLGDSKALSKSKFSLQLANKDKNAIYSSGRQKPNYLNNSGSKKASPNISGAGAALYGLYEKNNWKYYPEFGNRENNSRTYIPGAGAATYGMYNVYPSKIDKYTISYPYNAKGTLLSNRGSNAFGYPQMYHECRSGDKFNNGQNMTTIPETPISNAGTIPIQLDVPSSNNLSTTGTIYVQMDNTYNNSNNINYTQVNSRRSGASLSYQSNRTNYPIGAPNQPLPNRNTNSINNFYREQGSINTGNDREVSLDENYYFNAELNRRKEIIEEALRNKAIVVGKKTSTEDFYFSGKEKSSLKLSLNYERSNNKKGLLQSVIVKFYEKGKRTFYWCAWENRRSNFNSYKEFKTFWDERGDTLLGLTKKTGYNVKEVVSELVRIRSPFKK